MQALQLVTNEHHGGAGPLLFVYEEGRTVIMTGGGLPLSVPMAELAGSTRRAIERVLLVEDDPALARSIQRVFKFEGLNVETCSTCKEAETRLRGFDCAIFDLNLPDGSGLALAEMARAWVKYPIFYSATTDIGAVRQAQNLGVFVSKATGLRGLRDALGV
jgi:CheY-like chemotaxis protein